MDHDGSPTKRWISTHEVCLPELWLRGTEPNWSLSPLESIEEPRIIAQNSQSLSKALPRNGLHYCLHFRTMDARSEFNP